VLKRFGPGAGPVSFPMEGYTLALDLAATPANLKLIERLDQITLDHGGRFYLAKDARIKAATLHAADPRLERFAQWRRARGLHSAFTSAQSERLGL
jgi:decaprenylphospho-beta-D-ribofuranose 2-oxidase